MRLLWLFLVLALLVVVPFLLWGDQFTEHLDLQKTVDGLMELGRPWAWIGGIALLLSDLVLPVPGTVVMSALGYIYGPWLGGALAVMGSMLSGIVAYGLCWKIGRPAAEWAAASVSRNDAAYNAACAWALRAEEAECAKLLGVLAAEGALTRSELESDADLASFVPTAWMQELLGRLP